jgi:type IV secretion system protein VirB9
LLCLSASLAETVPVRGSIDGRIRTAVYNGDEVYRLRGYVGYQIDLEFEPGEIFTGLGAGDLEGLSFVGQDNHLFLKPRAARVATNLTVLTSGFGSLRMPTCRPSSSATKMAASRC